VYEADNFRHGYRKDRPTTMSKGKTDLIEFVSQCLGDNVAWSPYPLEYNKATGRKVVVKTRWAELFDDIEDKVRFVPCEVSARSGLEERRSVSNGLPDYLGRKLSVEGLGKDVVLDVDWREQVAQANIDLGEIESLKQVDFTLNTECPIQEQICDQLNIPFKEIRPTITENNVKKYKKPRGKYVCISAQSTAQCKYWHLSGWNKAVKLLKKLGYKVLCIDKAHSFGRSPVEGEQSSWNYMPSGARDATGNFPITHRVNQIRGCEFFIGLSSGLSWLAWALGKKVVLISGATLPMNEFKSDCFRVHNELVCNGCLNDEELGRVYEPEWFYCPRDKNFECGKKISFDMVKEQIIKCINTEDRKFA